MFSAGYAVRAAHEAPPGRLLPLQNRLPGVPVNGASTYTIAGIFVSIGILVRVALKYAQEH